jgi:hypothetical protein
MSRLVEDPATGELVKTYTLQRERRAQAAQVKP